jgi:DNA-directed RNA polymerase I subunit RPA2
MSNFFYQIPEDLEVGYVPLSLGGAYPGLYLFTNPSRFVRPVKKLFGLPDGNQSIELIGPFEQVRFDHFFVFLILLSYQ